MKRTDPTPAPAQSIGFAEWLMLVEEKLGYLVPSGGMAARLYNSGVSVMDAVVRLK